MLAIAQSHSTYHYLNWIPSEQGPLITHYGSIDKELIDLEGVEQHYYDLLSDIFSYIKSEEPICTFSLDRKHVLFSTCYAEDMNQDLIDWHFKQSLDNQLKMIMDYYHYPMELKSGIILNIGIPKMIRQSFLTNMRLLKSRLNSLSVGIFSAEIGARKWMQADKNSSYIIWKMGKKKHDEILYINNNELITYFCFHRRGEKSNLLWLFGKSKLAKKIMEDIVKVQKKEAKSFKSSAHVYLYTSEKNTSDIKEFYNLKIKNLSLLNPLSALVKINDDKINEFNSLPLAETGNSFRGIDV